MRFFTLLAALTLVGCSNSDSKKDGTDVNKLKPDSTSSFTADVNGQLWVADKCIITVEKDFFMIHGEKTVGTKKEVIAFGFPEAPKKSTYELKGEGSIQAQYLVVEGRSEKAYITSNQDTGSISITSIDPTIPALSAQFSFNARLESSGEVVSVQNGKIQNCGVKSSSGSSPAGPDLKAKIHATKELWVALKAKVTYSNGMSPQCGPNDYVCYTVMIVKDAKSKGEFQWYGDDFDLRYTKNQIVSGSDMKSTGQHLGKIDFANSKILRLRSEVRHDTVSVVNGERWTSTTDILLDLENVPLTDYGFAIGAIVKGPEAQKMVRNWAFSTRQINNVYKATTIDWSTATLEIYFKK